MPVYAGIVGNLVATRRIAPVLGVADERPDTDALVLTEPAARRVDMRPLEPTKCSAIVGYRKCILYPGVGPGAAAHVFPTSATDVLTELPELEYAYQYPAAFGVW